MEIDGAINGSSDTRLQAKYRHAVYVIQRAFALYQFKEVAFSFNGGKDSTVLLHLLRAGYYLYIQKTDSTNANEIDCLQNCPIRTIYFESPCAFPEINDFTYETAARYGLPLEIIRLDFRSGLEGLLNEKPTKAIFLGTRMGDPNAVGQEQFSPSSIGWPPFMRVNPILDWSYRDVWNFLLTCKVPYCSLYDKGYTSIGSIHDTVPNARLTVAESSKQQGNYMPAYMLLDGRLERAGRTRKYPAKPELKFELTNGVANFKSRETGSFTASIIIVGDEILFGSCEDKLSIAMCKKLHSVGWLVSHVAVVQNEVDSVADEVERHKSTNDMVFMFGGLGPLHSDVSLAGVAKAFGVRLAPDEEFVEYLDEMVGQKPTGHRNQMALLPEGITELLHNQSLAVPLIKCRNVIVLSATNVRELDIQWNCLLELPNIHAGRTAPFISKHLKTMLLDVEIAPVLEKISVDYPDIYLGCHREGRSEPLIISIVGKDNQRLELVKEVLRRSFTGGAFSEANENFSLQGALSASST